MFGDIIKAIIIRFLLANPNAITRDNEIEKNIAVSAVNKVVMAR